MSDLLAQLTSIRDARGALNAEIVLEEASDPRHPLHNRFDWDDTEAAHQWRLRQASQLLRVVRFRPDPTTPRNLRAFVAVRGRNTPRADYVPTEEALSDDFTRRLVLADMEREFRTLKRRYEHMREFADMLRREIAEEAG